MKAAKGMRWILLRVENWKSMWNSMMIPQESVGGMRRQEQDSTPPPKPPRRLRVSCGIIIEFHMDFKFFMRSEIHFLSCFQCETRYTIFNEINLMIFSKFIYPWDLGYIFHNIERAWHEICANIYKFYIEYVSKYMMSENYVLFIKLILLITF